MNGLLVVLNESLFTLHMELYITYLLLLLLRLAGYNACSTVDGAPCVFPFIYQVIIHEKIYKKYFELIREENTQTAQMQQTQLGSCGVLRRWTKTGFISPKVASGATALKNVITCKNTKINHRISFTLIPSEIFKLTRGLLKKICMKLIDSAEIQQFVHIKPNVQNFLKKRQI